MTEQTTLFVGFKKNCLPPSPQHSAEKYSVEYIKNYWANDCYIFDLRWLKAHGSKDDILECVKNNCFKNAGHSSFLLPEMKSEGWNNEQITDYLMTLRARHLATLKGFAEAELVRINFESMDADRIMTLYKNYCLYCAGLKQSPRPIRDLFEGVKSKHREELRQERQKVNNRILKIAEKVKAFEQMLSEETFCASQSENFHQAQCAVKGGDTNGNSCTVSVEAQKRAS